jgi:L-erythro-3,5-diaminohexanoate dehydrogenase
MLGRRPVLQTAAEGRQADPFGTHRVLVPKGGLPQAAQRLDNDFSRLFEGETLLAVETLNVDAASFRQMEEGVLPGESPEQAIVRAVEETVRTRGKQHNPATGSGGMLLGRVAQGATEGRQQRTVALGDRVATLVSLSLTPLRIDRIKAVHRSSAQIDVEGEAVLFATGAFTKLPRDFSERLAVALFDVAGAAPQVARLVKQNATVLVLGAGGKSGVLCCAQARRTAGPTARIVGVESHPPFADDLRALGICDDVILGDARDAVAVRRAVLAATDNREVDVTFSCVSVRDAEMSAILCTRDRGICYFFAMSTSFTQAALGAEGVGKDVDLFIGNGYAHGHAEHTIELVRSMPNVRELFERRYR